MTTLLTDILTELKAIRAQMVPVDDDELISMLEAAKYCGMSEKQLRRHIKEYKTGPQYYDLPGGKKFTRRALRAWLNEVYLRRETWRETFQLRVTAGGKQ